VCWRHGHPPPSRHRAPFPRIVDIHHSAYTVVVGLSTSRPRCSFLFHVIIYIYIHQQNLTLLMLHHRFAKMMLMFAGVCAPNIIYNNNSRRYIPFSPTSLSYGQWPFTSPTTLHPRVCLIFHCHVDGSGGSPSVYSRPAAGWSTNLQTCSCKQAAIALMCRPRSIYNKSTP